MNVTPWDDYASGMTNAEIAKSLEYTAERLNSGIAQAVMMEAAKRLRGEPEPHFSRPPLPDLPPLDAHAIPDPDSTPLGLIVDRIAREAIEKMRC